jgi:hypothetical protein
VRSIAAACVEPGTEVLGEMTKYNEELVRSGVMLAGGGLHPTSGGAKVRFDVSERTVVDGPFTEARRLSRATGCGSAVAGAGRAAR